MTVHRALTAATAGLVLLGAASPVFAASPEWETPAVSHKDVKPYLEAGDIADLVLTPPPVEGSLADADDVAAVQRRQAETSAARWKIAEADADSLYDRFAAVVGAPLTRARFPILIQLLNRSERQVGKPVFAAKDLYKRARPYQRLQLSHVCGRDGAPAPDPDAQKRTSYPSGHAAYGWTAALVLAKVAPDKAPAILQRGVDYSESRVICGMHFPSDVAAGRLMATAVVARLTTVSEFTADLACARQELAEKGLSAECAFLSERYRNGSAS
jgi:acid phosphatase (class A)